MRNILLLIALAISQATMAQVISIDGRHHGFADATTMRILVTTTPDDPTNAEIPATYTIDGTTYEVQTTTLPLIRLQHDIVNSETFTLGHLTLLDPAPADAASAVLQYSAQLRYRGGTALSYTKKNYAIKLVADAPAADTDQPVSLDASLLGMRNDNSWILDAMACDVARMRNRVSTDLWLDFSTRPYYARQAGADQPALEPEMTNGTHGRFVEVFVGDRYWGLYCLTEKIDRKQLKLKKFSGTTPRGILYKSFTFDNMHALTNPTPDNQSFTWQGWECSYPDVRKGEPIDWTPLRNLVEYFCLEIPDFDLIDHLWEHIDIPLWRDYNIFCDLLHADDNTSKNIYAYYRDVTRPECLEADPLARPLQPAGSTIVVDAPGPLCVCPWDLDATWGRDYKHDLVAAASNCNVSNATNYHIWLSQRDGGASYFTRWAELRQATFTRDNLWSYFQRYFDLFDTSGAANRETERWQGIDGVHLDFKAEARYIRNWIPNRLAYLDNDYEYFDAGIVTPPSSLIPQPSSGTYTLDGRRVTTQDNPKPLGPGLYIVDGKKKLVR